MTDKQLNFGDGLYLGFLACALLASVGVLGIMGTPSGARRDMRQEAIDAGVAHWEVNAQTGDRTFTYGVTE